MDAFHCNHCGYEVRFNESNPRIVVCPECGLNKLSSSSPTYPQEHWVFISAHALFIVGIVWAHMHYVMPMSDLLGPIGIGSVLVVAGAFCYIDIKKHQCLHRSLLPYLGCVPVLAISYLDYSAIESGDVSGLGRVVSILLGANILALLLYVILVIICAAAVIGARIHRSVVTTGRVTSLRIGRITARYCVFHLLMAISAF